MDFSIIIINYKTKELTKDCINSVLVNIQDLSFEIILIDNNSDDGSAEYFKEFFGEKIRSAPRVQSAPRLKVIANKENLGFGRANNYGAKIAQGDYLFFLNSDTIIGENIFMKFKNILDKKNNYGFIAPRLLLKNRENQDYAFGKFPSIFSTIFDKFKNQEKYQDSPFSVDWLSGAALVIQKNVFQKIGGFDEKFFMYFEDIDLCKRLKKNTFENWIFPEITLVHLGGKSIQSFFQRKKIYYDSQNYYFLKYFGFLGMSIMKFIRWPYKLFFKELK